VRFQIAFLHHAFVWLTHALDAILQLAAFIRELPNNFVIALGCPVADAAAEAHQLPGSKLMCHVCLQFFDASLWHVLRRREETEKPPLCGAAVNEFV
jgi:hypothetical protein